MVSGVSAIPGWTNGGDYRLHAGSAEQLREETCRALLGHLRNAGIPAIERYYEPGETIYGEEEHGNALYLVLEGAARIFVFSPGARWSTLRLAGPWEPLGLPIPGSCPSGMARAEAVAFSKLAKIPKVFVDRAVRESPETALKLTTLYGLELALREELFWCLLTRNTEVRLARLLPVLARQFPGANSTIGIRLTHYDLAAMVASTRESVNTALTALRRRGIVKKKGGAITVLRPEALSEIGCGQH